MILKQDDKRMDFEEASRRANEWAMRQLREQDKKFDLDMKKAEQFKETHFNKYAEPNDEKNAEILQQYQIMVDQAIRSYDDRLTRANAENIRIHAAIIERGAQSEKR